MTPFLRLRPDLPVCWEAPTTLRVGFERAEARIAAPSAGQQRLLSALRDGVPSAGLSQTARRAGATPREARELLAALEPALVPPAPSAAVAARARPRVRVDDGGRPAAAFAGALGWALGGPGPQLSPASDELVVYVERFLEPLERAQRWLIAGLPHLLVRFTDTRVHVGPLVVPPGQPCHTCATLAVRERDASAPVLAAQLVDAAPASESPTLAVLAATLAAQLIDAWGRGEARVHRSRVSVPAAQGRQAGPVEQHAVAPHPECACGVLGGGAGADGGTAVVAPATGPRAVRADRPLR